MKKLAKIFLMVTVMVSMTSCGVKNVGEVDKKVEVKEGEISKQETVEVEDEKSYYPLTITNYNYSKEKIPLTFNEIPEKVFCLYQNSIETMLALGLEDHIVAAAGLDHAVKPEYEEAFKQINYLSDFELSKESVVMLEPDFILAWMSPFNEKKLGDVDYWHERGTNTYMAPNSNSLEENKTLENEYKYITDIGKIFNVEEKANVIVDEIKNEVNRVIDATQGQEQQKVMIVEFMKDSIYTYGKNTLGGNMVTALGGELVEGAESTIGLEDLINLNPDIIYVVYMDRGSEEAAMESANKVLENKALASLKAVHNKRVYGIPLGEMYAAATRTIDGINTFAKGMYPELY